MRWHRRGGCGNPPAADWRRPPARARRDGPGPRMKWARGLLREESISEARERTESPGGGRAEAPAPTPRDYQGPPDDRRTARRGTSCLNCRSDLCGPCPTWGTAHSRRTVRRPDARAGTAPGHLASGGAGGASRQWRTWRRDGPRPGADMRAHEAGALHGNDAAPTW